MTKRMTVDIYTDGACHLNGKSSTEVVVDLGGKTVKGEIGPRAAWSFQVTGQMSALEAGQVVGEQDVNRAELMAFLEAIKWVALHPNVQARILTDSMYVYDRLGGDVSYGSNYDLWDQIAVLSESMSDQIISIIKIDRSDNEADETARKRARSLFPNKLRMA